MTATKLYAIYGPDDSGLRARLTRWAAADSDLRSEPEFVDGHEFPRIASRRPQVPLLKRLYWEIMANSRPHA